MRTYVQSADGPAVHRLDPFGAIEEMEEVFLPVSTAVQQKKRKQKQKQPKLAEYLRHKVPMMKIETPPPTTMRGDKTAKRKADP